MKETTFVSFQFCAYSFALMFVIIKCRVEHNDDRFPAGVLTNYFPLKNTRKIVKTISMKLKEKLLGSEAGNWNICESRSAK